MQCSGIVFNIQRYTIHDGPGVRTELFLKGCPLHCPWCSNQKAHSYILSRAFIPLGVWQPTLWTMFGYLSSRQCVGIPARALKIHRSYPLHQLHGLRRILPIRGDPPLGKKYDGG